MVRWNLTKIKSINSKKFDDAYQIACNTTSCANIVTQNPWLEWMNFTFDKATFSKKYLLYAGWIMYSSTDIIDNGSMNISNETLSFSAGIPSGGAEPVNSALWYTGNSPFPFILNGRLNETPFYTGCSKKANWDASQWFGGDLSALNITAMSQTDVCGNPVLISKSATLSTPNPNHPLGFQLRVFWDYDHETMVNGAYWGEGTGLFNTKNAGGWDKYINKGLFLTTGSSSSDTGFLNTKVNSAGDLVRDVYIAKAQGYLFNSESNTFPVNDPSTYNPLKLEPLFMVLHKDLLRTNNEIFVVP